MLQNIPPEDHLIQTELPQPSTRILQAIVLGIFGLVFVSKQLFILGSGQELLANSGVLWRIAFIVLGLGTGFALMVLDELKLYTYYQPEKFEEAAPSSMPTDEQATAELNQQPVATNSTPYLITRSIIFVLAYLPLSVLIYTSSGSPFGIALILAMGTCIAIELITLRNNQHLFQDRFLQKLKRNLTHQERARLVYIFSGLVGVLSILTLFRV